MKNIKSYFLPGLFLLALVGYRFYVKSRPVEIPKYGNYLSCVGNAYDLDVKLKGEVYLLEKALPSDQIQRDNLYGEAAFYQNLYAFTNLMDQNPGSSLKWVSFGTKSPKIKILSSESSEYPQTLTFENEHPILGFPDVAKNYLERLMPLSKIEKGDKAIKVTYELESELLTCFSDNNFQSFKNLKIYHPQDPYLAYFYVPKSHRVKLLNEYRKNAQGTYNPCMNPAGITASGFNAYGLYYFWRPEAQGHSADKIPFDCTLFYQLGKNINLAKVEVKESEAENINYFNFSKFDNLNRPIKFSVLMGGIEGKEFRTMNKKQVKDLVNFYLSDVSLMDARKNLPYDQYDRHLGKLMIILYKAKNHMQIFSHEVKGDELFVTVTLKGKLKLSKKDVEYTVFLSPNDPSVRGAEYFAEHFASHFLTKDIIAYEGHATAGSIFDKGLSLLKEKNYADQDKSIAYQIFAIHSCSSTFYYRPDSFPKVDNPEFRRDVIRTAGAYSDVNANGTLGILAALDQYLYNESYSPFAFWAKNFKSDNFYILSNHK